MTLGSISVGIGVEQQPPPPSPQPPPLDLSTLIQQFLPLMIIVMIMPMALKDFPKRKTRAEKV